MKQVQEMLSIETFGQGLTEITREIDNWVQRNDIFTGLLTIYIRHTSASLVVQENADPSVVKDLEAFFKKIAPEDTALYNHTAEGPDDMPAHIKGSLTETSISIPVDDNCMVLGTWQGIFLFEHRTRPHVRKVVLHMIGV
jgi:secondary thiamine-phosphate synthase enzyme